MSLDRLRQELKRAGYRAADGHTMSIETLIFLVTRARWGS